MPEPKPETVHTMSTPKRPWLRRVIDVLDGVPATQPTGQGAVPRGQSLIEVAFIIPVLLIMVMGIVEIGWYANNYINLLEAAKVGARRGPFLNDNNSPLLFDAASSYAPRVSSTRVDAGGNPLYPQLVAPGDPGFDAANPRNRLRGIDGPNATRCDGITNIQDYGFYNLILCTVLESLDPLSIRYGDDYTDTSFKDDVVISVFSIQHISNGVPRVSVPNPDTGQPYDFNINALSSVAYPPGDQVIVVGRWPYNANECQSGGVSQEGRDPFNYIVNDENKVDYGTITTNTGEVVQLPYELGVEVNDPITGAFVNFAPFSDAGNENQRGWAYTGQHIIAPVDSYAGDCYGSEFTLPEVQELVNLPRFIQQATATQNAQRRQYLPNQGLVLVEVFWEHNLLTLGTGLSQNPQNPYRPYEAYDILTSLLPGGADQVIHVWAAFPAPSAEPNIVFPPPAP